MVTIFYPDLSQYDAAVTIEPNTVIVGARATLSASVADTQYQRFKSEAVKQGAFFFAYHWLNHGNIAAQALWAYQHVGSVPLMLDVEDEPGNTGYAGTVTVQDVLSFVDAYRKLGGTCHLAYVPRWYWSDHMGTPDLTPLALVGLHLVSSSYTPYSDSGSGWLPYGGLTPVVWQYTDVLMYGGGLVDFNAFMGDVQSFIELATGDNMALTDDDIARIKVAVCGGNDALTMDNLQQWLGDGVDGRTNPPTPLSNDRPNMASIESTLAGVVSALAAITQILQNHTHTTGTVHVAGDLTVSE